MYAGTNLTLLKLVKKLHRWYDPRANAIRDLLIFFGVTTGAFLPARMLYYEYVTHHILPNMGVVTGIAVLMFLLVKYDKLGFVGRAFRRQMQRFTARRTFRRVLIISLIFNIYLGGTLILVERGEFHFAEERQNMNAIAVHAIVANKNPGYQEKINEMMNDGDYDIDRMLEVSSWTEKEKVRYYVDHVNDFDYMMSTMAHESNQLYGGWPSHFNTVFFVEYLEMVGLWFLYRRWYLIKTDSVPWGGFNENIKKIMYKTEEKDKLAELEIRPTHFMLLVIVSGIAGIIGYVFLGKMSHVLYVIVVTMVGQLIIFPKLFTFRMSPQKQKQYRRLILFCIMMIIVATGVLLR